MNDDLKQLSRSYGAALRRYLTQHEEASLERAYELGRHAIKQGLGVLDMARVHQDAIAGLLGARNKGKVTAEDLRMTAGFFMEILSPFEATHRGFREANLRLEQLNLTLAARNAELAAANKELEKQISERKRVEADLRRLSNRIIQVQEEERARISRELHDEVGQALTAVNVSLGVVKNHAPANVPMLKERLVDAQSLLAQTMESVHRFARELRPAMLDELGLVSALKSYLKGYRERTGLPVEFIVRGEVERVNDDQKTVLYRVAQESLNNIAKHAEASAVETVLCTVQGGIRMEVRDNGKAFPVEKHLGPRGRTRLGLLGMQERVRQVHGEFDIISVPGQGTTVRVTIPRSTRKRP